MICSLTGRLEWKGSVHELRDDFAGVPYPPKRLLAAAMSGDVEGTQALWANMNRVAELANSVLKDAKAVASSLRA